MTTTTTSKRPTSAWAVFAAREFRNLTRYEFADMLAEATGQPWDYNKVRRIELGERKISADEIRVISDLLTVPLEFLHRGWDSQSGWYGDAPLGLIPAA